MKVGQSGLFNQTEITLKRCMWLPAATDWSQVVRNPDTLSYSNNSILISFFFVAQGWCGSSPLF